MIDISKERAHAFLNEYKALCIKHGIQIDSDFSGSPMLDVCYAPNIEKLNLHLMGHEWYLSYEPN